MNDNIQNQSFWPVDLNIAIASSALLHAVEATVE